MRRPPAYNSRRRRGSGSARPDLDYGIDAVAESAGADGFTADYGLDAVGNVTSVSERGMATRTYGYDGLDRVSSVAGGANAESYTYDATGNRTSKTAGGNTEAYTYPTTSHRLSAVAGAARTYDAMGNMLTNASDSLPMTYDDRGRMRELRVNGNLQRTYCYNANAAGPKVQAPGSRAER
jgi:YD repeat-containing protein